MAIPSIFQPYIDALSYPGFALTAYLWVLDYQATFQGKISYVPALPGGRFQEKIDSIPASLNGVLEYDKESRLD